jgi:cytoskeleton protein RodZ
VGEFGDKFRKAREKKGISFDDASNVTKISSRMLQAIEEENFDRLPGGVFNKGFIRAYAKHLGLNEEEAIAAYLACQRKTQAEAQQAWDDPAEPHSHPPRNRRSTDHLASAGNSQPSPPVEELPELHLPRPEHVRPRRKEFADNSSREIPWGIIAVAAIVVVLAVILWMRRSHNSNTASAGSAPARTTQPAPLPASGSAPAQLPQTATGTNASSPSSTQTAAPTPAATAPHPATATPPNASPTANDNNDVTVHTSQKSNPKPSEPSAPTLTLVIRATETSWISLTADGQSVGQETLIAPARTSVRARREIVAKVGNAAGVTFLWNGQEIPAAGAESEVKTFIFDSTGMHVAPTAPPPAQNQ